MAAPTVALREGWYVISKNAEKNIVYISRNYYDDAKKRNTLIVGNFNWFTHKPENKNLAVKLRHGSLKYDCSIEYIEEDKAVVTLSKDDQGIAAGQFAVFYEN